MVGNVDLGRSIDRLRNLVSGDHPVKLLVWRCIGHFFLFLTVLNSGFCFCIFFWSFGNFVAGFLGV